MFKAYAPFLIQFSPEAYAMLGCSVSSIAPTIFRTVASAQGGFDLAYVPVHLDSCDYAASARIMPTGTIITEVDIAPTALTPRVIKGAALPSATAIPVARAGRVAR